MKNSMFIFLDKHTRIKKLIHFLMINPVRNRPRFWLRILIPLYINRGKGSVIYSSVRKDIVPFRAFRLGANSVIESYSTINNMVGDISIGDYSRIGIGNTLIGPVVIESNVMLAQNVVLSGMNHNYKDSRLPISMQGISSAPILISDGSWIGANVVITKGVRIGKNSVVAAGSVVTSDVDDYCVAAGIPAKIIKRYDEEKSVWNSC